MSTSDTPDPAHVALAVDQGRQTGLLAAILAEMRSDTLDVGVADYAYRQMVLDNFPVAGAKRVLVRRTGNGADTFPVPTTGALVLPDNAGRLGGTIVNSGANPVILYLCDGGAARPGSPAIYLAANGGSWDFKLGNLLWCGNVSAVAQTAASTLTVAEV